MLENVGSFCMLTSRSEMMVLFFLKLEKFSKIYIYTDSILYSVYCILLYTVSIYTLLYTDTILKDK